MVGANTEAFTSFAFKYFQKFDWLKNLQMNTLMGVSFLLIKSELLCVCICTCVRKHLSDISVKSARQKK